MSLSLLATTLIERVHNRTRLIDRMRTSMRALVPDHPPVTYQPGQSHREREQLRSAARARGGVIEEIETIRGDCPVQTAQQIRDLTRWLNAPRG
jgi:hypothetical protein